MARVEVVMPQMGESIVEGTIVEWIKKVGDAVEIDEDIFTLSTDKVDAEVPSPVRGVLVETRAAVGDTVAVGTVVAVIETEAAAAEAPEPQPEPAPVPQAPAPVPGAAQASVAEADPSAAPSPQATASSEPAAQVPASPGPNAREPDTTEALRPHRATPVVRKIAAEHSVHDLSVIAGTGAGGRVTKKDILAYIASGGVQPATPSESAPPRSHVTSPSAPAIPPIAIGNLPEGWDVALVRTPRIVAGARDRVEPMTRMQSVMADNMLQSRRAAAHCHTVWEADMTRVAKARKALAPELAARGVKLTFTPFFLSAVTEGLRQFPLLNAAVDGRNIVYRADINLGVAVAIESGLIVPVLKNADTLNLFGLAKGVGDLAERAASGNLKPADVADGTFTVSNPGIWGSLYGVPVLVQPQVGILGIGGIKKRVVADEHDNIRVRSIATLALSFDHRVIDGATADGFMKFVTEHLANWE